ncbi:hypothetical protein KQR57_14985 [Bacillus inaquosorum]|nr:hypothetical protein [Bacillus inaquosorum]
MNSHVESALTKSKEEQTIIAGKLKDNKTQLSAKEAVATVKNSKKQKTMWSRMLKSNIKK